MNNTVGIETLVDKQTDDALKYIGKKILNNQRLHFDEGVMLFEKASLPYVGALANHVREKLHGNRA